MKIQEVEQRTGLDRATIRFYETEGLISPVRSDNGYRCYTETEVDTLLKIKLLRQLDINLSIIKDLEQGREDISAVLSCQLDALSDKITGNIRAKYVCEQMQQANLQYKTIDTARYLKMLQIPECEDAVFCEEVPLEIHPVRRFFARTIDYAIISAVLNFLLITVFRIRPITQGILTLISIIEVAASVLILSAFVHFLGTTPGKWAMGIYVGSIFEERITYSDAIRREIKVFVFGCGLNIPGISLWRYYKSYKKDASGEGNRWNEYTEFYYSDWTVARKALGTILAVVAATLSAVNALENALPQYRGDVITVAQFAENYRDYEKALGIDSKYVLGNEGKWIQQYDSSGVIVSVQGENFDQNRADFMYSYDSSGKLYKISYTDSWEDGQFLSAAIPYYCHTAAIALIGSRPGAGYQDLKNAEEWVDNLINEQIITDPEKGNYKGDTIVHDVKIAWDIRIENYASIGPGGIVIASDDAVIYVKIVYSIEIVE